MKTNTANQMISTIKGQVAVPDEDEDDFENEGKQYQKSCLQVVALQTLMSKLSKGSRL